MKNDGFGSGILLGVMFTIVLFLASASVYNSVYVEEAPDFCTLILERTETASDSLVVYRQAPECLEVENE